MTKHVFGWAAGADSRTGTFKITGAAKADQAAPVPSTAWLSEVIQDLVTVCNSSHLPETKAALLAALEACGAEAPAKRTPHGKSDFASSRLPSAVAKPEDAVIAGGNLDVANLESFVALSEEIMQYAIRWGLPDLLSSARELKELLVAVPGDNCKSALNWDLGSASKRDPS